MNELNVLYTINSLYIDIMLGSIYSLIINGGIKNIKLHIVTSNFEEKDYQKIEKTLKGFSGIEINFYNLANFPIEKYNLREFQGSQIANARLFFASILGDKLDTMNNLLYLDADTIIVSSLLGINYYNNNSLNAVRETNLRCYNENLGLNDYYNSGVLYFNVNNWKNLGLEDKIIHFIENNSINSKHVGQDILNCALATEFNPMPLNYNLGPIHYFYGEVGNFMYFSNPKINGNLKLVKDAKMHPVIFHSYGFKGIKPWSENDINPFTEIFMEYIKMANPNFQPQELKKSLLKFDNFPLLLKAQMLTKSFVESQEKKKVFVRK